MMEIIWLIIVSWQMYSPPSTAPGNNGEQSFVAGANPLALLDHAMDFDEHILFQTHNVGMQDGARFYNPTTGIFLLSFSLCSFEKVYTTDNFHVSSLQVLS